MADKTRPFGQLFAEPPRNGLTRPKAVRGVGTKMVNMGELFAFPRIRNASMDRVPLNDFEAQRFVLSKGDLLFARQSLVLEGAGKCSLFVDDDEPVTFESHITRVRLDPQKADPSFYFYYLQSHHGKSAIRGIVEQGAGASAIRGSDLATLEVGWLPLPEQRTIANILGTLDDKIDLNRQMAQTLEEMARAIFKSWFIDFDPVRAKAEGRPTGLPPEIDALFPDSFDDSELGPIPTDWKVGKLGDLCRNLRRPAPVNSISAGEPYVGLDAISRRSLALMTWGKGDQVESQKSRFKNGEILFGKLRPYFHKICIAPVDGVCSTDILVIDSIEHIWYSFAVLMLSEVSTIEFVTAASDGTRMPRTNWEDLDRMPVIIPPIESVSSFNRAVLPLLERLQRVCFGCQNLEAIRDALLPKLVMGELRLDPEGFHSGEDA